MVEWLRALDTFAEDLGLVPSVNMVSIDSSSMGFNNLL